MLPFDFEWHFGIVMDVILHDWRVPHERCDVAIGQGAGCIFDLVERFDVEARFLQIILCGAAGSDADGLSRRSLRVFDVRCGHDAFNGGCDVSNDRNTDSHPQSLPDSSNPAEQVFM